MDNDTAERQNEEASRNEQDLMDRRRFLHSLQKWSKIVIGCVLAGSAIVNTSTETEAAGWANRGGGGGAAWANRAGGGAAVVHPPSGGTAWGNHAGGGGGAAWANRAGGGGAAWANRGAAWANGGTVWVNRF
jgi:hypothetical protein